MARTFRAASSDNILFTNPLTTDYPFTMACWFRTATSGTGGQTLMNIADTSSNGIYYRLVINEGSSNRLEAEARNTTLRSSVTSGTISTGTWYHAAGVYATSTSRLSYLSGAAGTEDTNTVSFNSGCDYFSLGSLYRASPTQYLDGALAEAAIWTAALSAGEIGILAKGYSPLLIRPASLFRYWPLAERATYQMSIVKDANVSVSNSSSASANHPPMFYPARRGNRFGVPGNASLRRMMLLGAGA